MLVNLKSYEDFSCQSTCFLFFFLQKLDYDRAQAAIPWDTCRARQWNLVSRALIAIDAIIILTHHKKKGAVQGYSQPYHTLTKQLLCLMLFIVRKGFAINQSHLLRTVVFVQKKKRLTSLDTKVPQVLFRS